MQLSRGAAGRAAAKPEDAAAGPLQPQGGRPVLAEKDGGYESDTEEGAAAAAAVDCLACHEEAVNTFIL